MCKFKLLIALLDINNQQTFIFNIQNFTSRTRYYYRIPSYGIGKFENQFLRPLSTAAWWCVVAMAILCGIVLTLSAIVEKRPTTIDFAFFSVSALICQQCKYDIINEKIIKAQV